MDGIRVENSQGVIANSTVNANGDILVNGQKVTNYFYSAQYQDLKNQWDKLQARFSIIRQKTEKYPDDEDFKTELLQIDEERNAVQKKLDDLKHEVIGLAETFTKIPINTKRLRLARQHFEAGDYAAARTILDAGEMGSELDALLHEKQHLQHQQTENEAHLTDKAYEFLILARLTAVNFTLASRYDKTLEYFEQSLKAAHTIENTFAYAYFLQQHNQFIAALPFYTEALEIYRRLAEANPQAYLPYVAATLNNLAVLQQDKNDFPAAEAGYQEALEIYRRLAGTNPQTYLSYVAGTLNNLALLQQAKNDLPAAETGYQDALKIYRRLAEANPQTYLPDVAMTLNNLAILQQAKNDFPAAETGYQEALAIYRRLAEANPQTYLPDVAMTAVNMSIFHLDAVPDRERSLAHAKEALVAALPFVEFVPAVQNNANMALKVAEAWGQGREAFIEEAVKHRKAIKR